MKNKSWRTTCIGIAAILWGLWLAHVLYVSTNTFGFNLTYSMPQPTLFILIGIGLVYARDHGCKDE
jgi:hypothetical protein